MNQVNFSSIQSPMNQLAIQTAIMFLVIGVTFELVYILLLKIHAPKTLASVITTVCTVVVACKTISMLYT
ncbi:hypothetical protein [Bacillus cereus group sp. BfR-BA-01355]|uniref:hypothetical protein n=1 Tax=Bacillus cereus group TaxID=86661 RepID=UPI001F57804C|nr:hypothetical protein [Bacillus cereus group sp. BfR-BA-01355]